MTLTPGKAESCINAYDMYEVISNKFLIWDFIIFFNDFQAF